MYEQVESSTDIIWKVYKCWINSEDFTVVASNTELRLYSVYYVVL